MPAKGWKKAPDGTWTPPSQMAHSLDVSEDTQEFIEGLMDKWLAGKTIRATGEAVKGFLSNPANTVFILGGATAIAAGIVGEKGIGSVIDYFGSLQALFDAKTTEEKSAAAFDLAESMRALIRFFSPAGPLTPLP